MSPPLPAFASSFTPPPFTRPSVSTTTFNRPLHPLSRRPLAHPKMYFPASDRPHRAPGAGVVTTKNEEQMRVLRAFAEEQAKKGQRGWYRPPVGSDVAEYVRAAKRDVSVGVTVVEKKESVALAVGIGKMVASGAAMKLEEGVEREKGKEELMDFNAYMLRKRVLEVEARELGLDVWPTQVAIAGVRGQYGGVVVEKGEGGRPRVVVAPRKVKLSSKREVQSNKFETKSPIEYFVRRVLMGQEAV